MGLSGAAGCTALCLEAVFCCTLLHCPSRKMLYFLLGCRSWASWWAKLQVFGDDAVVVEGRRQSVDALPLSRRPVPLFERLVFSVSIFAGWPRWGATRPDAGPTGKRQFEVQRWCMFILTYREFLVFGPIKVKCCEKCFSRSSCPSRGNRLLQVLSS